MLLSFGARFLLWGHKSLFGHGFCSHIHGKTKKKEQKSSLKMYTSGIGPVAFLWGTIFAWGQKNLL